ncbi:MULTISPECIES: hypothetical protein [Gammaproteobacteria]|uniref:hypothetical protein n=1 Tax=Gammaproteobacteria TaxID=1236 RepID=UPI000DD0781B|nr:MULTISPECIES: hypothetical protein [Gammaproteobacteria]RTE87722.1 hypothetical protein DQX04_04970 [Aliidiomarina sp. B3213]TCZ92496.1 hypothetical protein EYQ95_00325 [Lysobacter sp. N42]
MYSDQDLQNAAEAGVFKHEQVDAFKEWVNKPQENTDLNIADEEQFRLVSGFNDIFVVIACVLTIIAVSMIGQQVDEVVGGLAAAGLAWGLGEYFINKRHMALPAIVLMFAFVVSIFYAGAELISHKHYSIVLACGLSIIASYGHWLRFRVPITVAALAAAGVGLLISLAIAIAPGIEEWLHVLTFVLGLAVFIFAMYWDSQDLKRVTRKSDVAFWLHLLASPLLVHSVFQFIEVGDYQGISLLQAALVLVTYGILAFISLAVDRRALMVSALAYVIYAFSSLLSDFGIVSLNYALTILVVGGSLLLLSVYWHNVRNKVVGVLPEAVRLNLIPSTS